MARTAAATGAALVLVLLGVASIAQSRSNSFRFTDGSFSLHAPFWITWPHSFARLLWIWGWPAVLVLLVFGDARFRRGAFMALAWIGIALVPYSFLTYSTQIPSRQVYLASAGLALLVGLALAQVSKDTGSRPWFSPLMLLHNTRVLVDQEARTIRGARGAHGTVDRLRAPHSGCDLGAVLPAGGDYVAEEAVRLATGRSPSDLVWSAGAAREREAAAFCYADK